MQAITETLVTAHPALADVFRRIDAEPVQPTVPPTHTVCAPPVTFPLGPHGLQLDVGDRIVGKRALFFALEKAETARRKAAILYALFAKDLCPTADIAEDTLTLTLAAPKGELSVDAVSAIAMLLSTDHDYVAMDHRLVDAFVATPPPPRARSPATVFRDERLSDEECATAANFLKLARDGLSKLFMVRDGFGVSPALRTATPMKHHFTVAARDGQRAVVAALQRLECAATVVASIPAAVKWRRLIDDFDQITVVTPGDAPAHEMLGIVVVDGMHMVSYLSELLAAGNTEDAVCVLDVAATPAHAARLLTMSNPDLEAVVAKAMQRSPYHRAELLNRVYYAGAGGAPDPARRFVGVDLAPAARARYRAIAGTLVGVAPEAADGVVLRDVQTMVATLRHELNGQSAPEIMAGGYAVYASDNECAVCMGPMALPTTTACGHRFCGMCVRKALETGPCPVCRGAARPLALDEGCRRVAPALAPVGDTSKWMAMLAELVPGTVVSVGATDHAEYVRDRLGRDGFPAVAFTAATADPADVVRQFEGGAVLVVDATGLRDCAVHAAAKAIRLDADALGCEPYLCELGGELVRIGYNDTVDAVDLNTRGGVGELAQCLRE